MYSELARRSFHSDTLLLQWRTTALLSSPAHSSKSLSEPDQSLLSSSSFSSLSLSSSKYFTGAFARPARGARERAADSKGSSSLELSVLGLDFFGGDFWGCGQFQRTRKKANEPFVKYHWNENFDINFEQLKYLARNRLRSNLYYRTRIFVPAEAS